MNQQQPNYYELMSILDISYNSVYQALLIKDTEQANKEIQYLIKNIERIKKLINQ